MHKSWSMVDAFSAWPPSEKYRRLGEWVTKMFLKICFFHFWWSRQSCPIKDTVSCLSPNYRNTHGFYAIDSHRTEPHAMASLLLHRADAAVWPHLCSLNQQHLHMWPWVGQWSFYSVAARTRRENFSVLHSIAFEIKEPCQRHAPELQPVPAPLCHMLTPVFRGNTPRHVS